MFGINTIFLDLIGEGSQGKVFLATKNKQKVDLEEKKQK
jgi:hypothetical protein